MLIDKGRAGLVARRLSRCFFSLGRREDLAKAGQAAPDGRGQGGGVGLGGESGDGRAISRPFIPARSSLRVTNSSLAIAHSQNPSPPLSDFLLL